MTEVERGVDGGDRLLAATLGERWILVVGVREGERGVGGVFGDGVASGGSAAS